MLWQRPPRDGDVDLLHQLIQNLESDHVVTICRLRAPGGRRVCLSIQAFHISSKTSGGYFSRSTFVSECPTKRFFPDYESAEDSHLRWHPRVTSKSNMLSIKASHTSSKTSGGYFSLRSTSVSECPTERFFPHYEGAALSRLSFMISDGTQE